MAVWSEIPFSTLGESLRIDAEFYQPHHLELERKLESGFHLDGILEYLTDGTHITPRYTEHGVPFLSSGNVQPFYIDFTEVRFISDDEHRGLQHCQPQPYDVLLSKSGRIGHAGVVPSGKKQGDFNIYEGIALIRVADFDPHVLSAILNSSIVQRQFKRRLKGVAQPHIHLEDIRMLRIPSLACRTQRQIRSRVLDGISKHRNARSLYAQAEELLLKDMGLPDLDLPPALFYERRLSQVRQAARFDPEYYQPKYYRLLKTMEKTKRAVPLGSILRHCERGLQPKYDEEGEIVVVNTKHIGAQFVADDLERCSQDAWEHQKRAQLQQYDVLFYSTGAYIGRTNCWLNDCKAIGSNHVTIIRPRERCNPIYLSLFMNSPVGLMQADRHAHGSAQREVYPADIRAYTVWLPTMRKQEKLAQMLLDSKAARDESRHLLDEAKRMVEEAVLGKERPC